MGRPQTAGNGKIEKRQEQDDRPRTLAGVVQQSAQQLARALPTHLHPERMVRIATTALRTTRNLDKCDQGSFLGCLFELSQLGLEPNTPLGHAYLIPRKHRDSGRFYCSKIIGYQGYIELAWRSGMLRNIYADCVREGDRFDWAKGLTPRLEHTPSDAADRDEKPITHAYAVAHIKGGDPVFEVLSRADIEKRRKRGAAADSFSPWVTDYEAMARKSAVRALWKWLPKSAEMQRAYAIDQQDTGRPAPLEPETEEQLQAIGVQPTTIEAQGEEQPRPQPTETRVEAPPKVQWGEGEGQPITDLSADQLARYIDAVEAEMVADPDLEPHLEQLQAEMERRRAAE